MRSGDWTDVSVGRRENNAIRIQGGDSTGWEYLAIELAPHDGQPITEGGYTDQRALVINHGLGWWDEGAEFTVEHHYNDRPNSTFRAKISYRR